MLQKNLLPISLIKIRNKFITFKFLQSDLHILLLVFLIEKTFKKMNCGRWSENHDVTFPDSISSKEDQFEKLLSINIEVLEILVGRTIYEVTKS